MSRLDSAIRRLTAQRACLDWACAEIAGASGIVLELGLGNGRTYDHLVSRLPDREIYAFDRALACHPASRPPKTHYYEGEISVTLAAFANTHSSAAILAHLDLGAGERAQTALNLEGVIAPLARVMAPGGIVLSDQPLPWEGAAVDLPLPRGIAPNRYFLYGFHKES
jgi:SAM-dependent methyltransferase